MREDQTFRRLAYIAFGALPAVLTTVSSLFLADVLTWVGAIIGTLGLCAATFTRLPPDPPDVGGAIAVALIVGLVTTVTWIGLFLYMFVSGSIDPDIGVGDALRTCWLLIGPMVVALHCLISLNRQRKREE